MKLWLAKIRWITMGIYRYSGEPSGPQKVFDHPKVWVFMVWVFEKPNGSDFLGSEVSRHPEGLRF